MNRFELDMLMCEVKRDQFLNIPEWASAEHLENTKPLVDIWSIYESPVGSIMFLLKKFAALLLLVCR